MTDFTPGPWVSIVDDSGTGKWTGWPLCINAENDPEKCVVRTGGFWPYDWGTATSQREAGANARLIAAAPDMYAALKGIVDNGIWNAEWDVARAVLAKVDGK